MTLLERLTKQARSGASIIQIANEDVRSLAEVLQPYITHPAPVTVEQCEAGLRRGQFIFLDVPIRVVSQPTE